MRKIKIVLFALIINYIYTSYTYNVFANTYLDKIESGKSSMIVIVILAAIYFIFIMFITKKYISYLRNKIIKGDEELLRQKEWLKITLSSIGEAVITIDEYGIINFVNPVAQLMIGLNSNSIVEEKIENVLHIVSENRRKSILPSIYEAMHLGNLENFEEDSILISENGTEYYISISIAPIIDDTKKLIGAVMVFRDVTEKRKQEIKIMENFDELERVHEELAITEAELREQYSKIKISKEALRASEERYRIAVDGVNDGLWDYDFRTRYFVCSSRCKQILGYSETDIDNSFKTCIELIYTKDKEKFMKNIKEYIEGNRPYFTHEVRVMTKDSGYKWVLIRGKAIFDENRFPLRMAGSITDITEIKINQDIIYNMAYYDSLTKLPNRSVFLNKLTSAIDDAQKNDKMVAVIFLDLDNFKYFNDTFGHTFGDNLLVKVGEILNSFTCYKSKVARFGGDEFVFMITDFELKTEVIRTSENILEAFHQPIKIDGKEIYTSVSMGIAFYPENGKDVQTLLKSSDSAMYCAKESGKNNFKLYSAEMNEKIVQKLQLENSLRHALKYKEFIVLYQPKVDINTGRIEGMEALVRWRNASGKLIYPNVFIPVAEESGIIVSIDEVVLREACKQNKKWQLEGYHPIRVAVNISARQFQRGNIVKSIKKILRDTGLNPNWLELEITESIAMKDFDYTIEVLNDLKKLGIRISLDDFGIGYSSLNYLKKLPIDTLKIDKSFINDIDESSNGRLMLKSLIMLAHSFELTVVAEGVETDDQMKFLKEQGCDLIQGYLFSKPVTPADFEAMLLDN